MRGRETETSARGCQTFIWILFAKIREIFSDQNDSFQMKMFLRLLIIMSPNEKPLIPGFPMAGIRIAL